MATLGVLVMAYGGPDHLDQVEPYLANVRGGRPATPEIVQQTRERYRKIGGRSPILEQTQLQASAIEAALNAAREKNEPGFKTFVGMRHWRPYIKDALAEIEAAGIERAIGLVMAPHYSRMSVGAYFEQVESAKQSLDIRYIERWGELDGYLDALAQRVQTALERFPVRSKVPIIFTAHSLPQRILEWSDPYPAELQATVAGVMERLGPHPHEFAFQSAASTPEPWLGPEVGEALTRLAARGERRVLIAPIGFVCEHVEVLYDVDIALKQQAEKLGVRLERIELPNTAPSMIVGLAGLIHRLAVREPT